MGTLTALGLDLGSATTKLVGIDAAGAIVMNVVEQTDPRGELQAERLLAAARQAGGQVAPVVATGYGRKLVGGAARTITEVTCHARGVFRATGRPGTVLDVGGQDSKVIVLGPDGGVVDFAMNDKCAAGTGRFLENTAARLRVPIGSMAELALSTAAEVPISSTCTVFAESEIVGLLARGAPVSEIVRGLHRALVQRLAALVRSVRLVPPLVLSGGVALSPAVRAFLEEATSEKVVLPEHPQLMGAYGAALIAADG
jgi:predicted CoA-substrate-specific enzyme activase